uniref:Peptidase M12B domain-containing protein n=1 Tax=Amblyomma maculatum TaxID=34609 RepID=G3MQ88_AMBMU
MIRFMVVAVFFFTAEATENPRLVYPRLLEERSMDGRMVLHLHDDLTLNLRKASVAASEFRVLENIDGHDVTHFFKGEDIDRHLHEDENQFASVHVMKRENGVEIEGVVGPDHRIQPMPQMERSEEGLIPHFIHKIERKEMFDSEVQPRWNAGAQSLDERSSGTQSVPVQVEVEIFVVSDNRHHTHFGTTEKLIMYICVHVNSMNIRYAETSNPRVRFLLVGVERDKHSTYRQGDGIYMNSSPTLDAFKRYAGSKKHEFGNPDVTYLMTGYDTYNPGPNNAKQTNTLGVGFVGGLCTDFFVALGEDTAGLYNGMHTMAHETAHLLGASHDESEPKEWIPGDPGSKTCKWNLGYLMSYVDGGTRHHRFSWCSLRQIRNLVVLRGRVCWMTNNPGHKNEGRYAGMYVKPNDYCSKLVFPGKNNVTADMGPEYAGKCRLKCQYPEYSRKCTTYGCYSYVTTHYRIDPSLDYMSCGGRKVCMQGICTPVEDVITAKPNITTAKPGVTTEVPDTEPPKPGDDQCRCDCSTTVATTTATGYGPRVPSKRRKQRTGQ